MLATNRIQRDLVGSNPHVISAVLSAIPHILSVGIAQYIASDVIKLMNSAKAAVRIKVVCVFFHICGSCSSLSSSSYLVFWQQYKLVNIADVHLSICNPWISYSVAPRSRTSTAEYRIQKNPQLSGKRNAYIMSTTSSQI